MRNVEVYKVVKEYDTANRQCEEISPNHFAYVRFVINGAIIEEPVAGKSMRLVDKSTITTSVIKSVLEINNKKIVHTSSGSIYIVKDAGDGDDKAQNS